MASCFNFSGGCWLSVVACFLVASAHAEGFTAEERQFPVETVGQSVKVSDLPSPTAGILGLSPLIQPISQYIHVEVNYPGSYLSNIKDRFSLHTRTTIAFQCTQPTKRITVHGNAEWNIQLVSVHVEGAPDNNFVKSISFNAADETLIVDVVDNLKTGVNYTLRVNLDRVAIDEDDQFGLQVFNRTREDTGDDLIMIGLSTEPKAMRHMTACFDDPAYLIPYTFFVQTNFGIYPPTAAMMQAPRSSGGYNCQDQHSQKKTTRYQYTVFNFPAMAIEAAHLRIVPYSWYPSDVSVPKPPAECY